jgi:hypothetical protein
MEDEGNSRNYANVLRSGIRKQKKVPKYKEHETPSWNRRLEFRRGETPRRSFSTRKETIFLNHCYACRNFWHNKIQEKTI